MILCPLCLNTKLFTMITGPDKRTYRSCDSCKLIFTDTRYQPTRKEAEKRFKTNKNGIQYPTYLEILKQAFKPDLPFINSSLTGLDYGCGPEPTLSTFLDQEDITCDSYDPIFFPELPQKQYDFIFSTECFEHFFLPAKEMQQIKKMLKPEGILIVLTELWTNAEAFAKWNNAKDAMHVSFYHRITMDFICTKYGFSIIPSDNPEVTVFQKVLSEEKVPA